MQMNEMIYFRSCPTQPGNRNKKKKKKKKHIVKAGVASRNSPVPMRTLMMPDETTSLKTTAMLTILHDLPLCRGVTFKYTHTHTHS